MKKSWKSNFLPLLVLLVIPISMIAVGLKVSIRFIVIMAEFKALYKIRISHKAVGNK